MGRSDAARGPVIFVDRNLGKGIVEESLGTVDAVIVGLDDEFDEEVTDDVWIRRVGENGWSIMTRDAKVRSRPLERRALLEAEVSVFFVGANLNRSQLVDCLRRALPEVIAIASRPDIVWMSIHRDGRLAQLPRESRADAETAE